MGNTPLLVALDLGSTTCKAAAFDLNGNTIAESTHEIASSFTDRTSAEIDPEEWWRIAAVSLRQVTECLSAKKKRIGAIGVTGLTHAPVLLDERGNRIASAPLWMDRRSIRQCEELNANHSEVIIREFGRPFINSLTAPKLKWFSENVPNVIKRAKSILMAKDYIRYRLTGTIFTDYSDADGTGLLNTKNRQWSDELSRLVGINPTQLPPLRDSHEVAGFVTEDAARLTGLPAGLPVVVGGSDVLCSLIGIGLLRPELDGKLVVYVGTAAWVAKITRKKATVNVMQNVAPCIEWVGATASAGSSVTWLRDVSNSICSNTRIGDISYDVIFDEAAKAPIGSNGLFFHPHLMGERGPYENPRATGVWFGLTRHHRFRDLARSVLEGVAYSIRALTNNDELQTVDDVVIFGGGSRNSLWRSIIRDVIGKALLVPRYLEGGLIGAALLAGVGVGFFADYEQATEQFIPFSYAQESANQDAAIAYERLFNAYLRLDSSFENHYDLVSSRGCGTLVADTEKIDDNKGGSSGGV